MKKQIQYLLRISANKQALWSVVENLDLEVNSRSAAKRKATQIEKQKQKEYKDTPLSFEIIEREFGSIEDATA
jgi:hypothetical protein